MKYLYNFILILPLYLLLIFSGSDCNVQDQKIVIEGKLLGNDNSGNTADPETFELIHIPNQGNPRIDYNPQGSISNLFKAELKVSESTGLPFNEEFFFLNLSRKSISPSPLQLTDNANWLNNHRGDLIILPIRKDDVSLPENSFNFSTSTQQRLSGAGWLARVENNDPLVSWIIDSSSFSISLVQSLTAPPQGQTADFFDMQTLSSMFLTSFALSTANAIKNLQIPLTTVSASNHKLYFIPHLTFGSNDTPGFGFIYSVDIDVDLGVNIGKAVVFVPISFLFTQNAELFIDPLSIQGLQTWENKARITVEYEGIIGGIIADQIRTNLVEAIDSVKLPDFSAASFEEGLALMLYQSASPALSTLNLQPSDFNVVALPEQRVTTASPITNEALRIPNITISTFTPAGTRQNGITLAQNGSVTITRIFGTAPSDTARVTLIQPIQTVNPFVLRFLN